MNIVGAREIEALITRKGDHCISIYLPIHRLGDQQDSIRYKNLLGEAERLLVAKGMRSAEAVKLLAPEYELAGIADYWINLGADGLAVFCDNQLRLRYSLPRTFAESITVAENFRVKPLIPLVSGGGSFFVLTLNRKETRLYIGSRFSITEAGLPDGTPAGLADTLQYDDAQKQLQFHTKTGFSGEKRGAMFHGHGVGVDEERENITRFTQQLAKKLHPVFIDRNIPVVLVGTGSLPSLYRKQDQSGMLLPETIDSNPEALTQQALHEMSWQIVGPVFAEKERDARAKFEELHGTGKTSADITEILDAAESGRVDILFAAENEEQWGIFDLEKRQVSLSPEDAVDASDLLDQAVAWTLKNNGTVYVKLSDEMPVADKLAAILRY